MSQINEKTKETKEMKISINSYFMEKRKTWENENIDNFLFYLISIIYRYTRKNKKGTILYITVNNRTVIHNGKFVTSQPPHRHTC